MADKIRVLHIAEAPGGVERYLVTLLTKLKDDDHYEHILVCSDSYDEEKFNNLVSYSERITALRNPISFFYDSKAIFEVRKAIRKYNPDIIYCHSSKAGAIGRLANIAIKKKLIYNAHGWSFNMKGTNTKKVKLYEFIEMLLAPMADKIVCISEYEKKSALEHKICKEDKLVIINNGIDFNEFISMKPKSKMELEIPTDSFVVGTVGRLTQQKAPDTFVKMAIEVKKKIPEAFFLMVGDGYQRGEISETLKNEGLEDSFYITGWVDKPLNYISCFDVATLMSRWEGFGLVLPEYMLLGKPIVATKADAIPYIIGDAGMLIDIDDPLQAAYSVIDLYKNKETRSLLIEKGKKRVREFDACRTAKETVQLFEELYI